MVPIVHTVLQAHTSRNLEILIVRVVQKTHIHLLPAQAVGAVLQTLVQLLLVQTSIHALATTDGTVAVTVVHAHNVRLALTN